MSQIYNHKLGWFGDQSKNQTWPLVNCFMEFKNNQSEAFNSRLVLKFYSFKSSNLTTKHQSQHMLTTNTVYQIEFKVSKDKNVVLLFFSSKNCCSDKLDVLEKNDFSKWYNGTYKKYSMIDKKKNISFFMNCIFTVHIKRIFNDTSNVFKKLSHCPW